MPIEEFIQLLIEEFPASKLSVVKYVSLIRKLSLVDAKALVDKYCEKVDYDFQSQRKWRQALDEAGIESIVVKDECSNDYINCVVEYLNKNYKIQPK